MYASFVGLDEAAAKEEARINIQSGSNGFSNADVVVKVSGWDSDYSKTVAQATLSALKQLILSDKKLPGVYFYAHSCSIVSLGF